MAERVVRLPDVGEGIAEAELVAWHVAVGEQVTAESVVAEVLTDKATIEISAPTAGVITFLNGTPGQTVAVGSDLFGIDTGADAAPVTEDSSPVAAGAPADSAAPATSGAPAPSTSTATPAVPPSAPPAPAPPSTRSGRFLAPRLPATPGRRPTAAPAVRRRARELGIDLHTVAGSGPGGRIVHADLDQAVAGPVPSSAGGWRAPTERIERRPVTGLRRRIAERLTEAARIPQITYVEEIDVTELETLRDALNDEAAGSAPRLTILPFLVTAVTRALAAYPLLNATYDEDAGELVVAEAVHVGIATQTPNGLVVPVVRQAQSLDLWQCAAEIARLAAAARNGTARPEELRGSTITITSLGALGGVVTTPLLNPPEVAIIGVNKLRVVPHWRDGAFVARSVINLSSTFDHRMVDGWDAAVFVQRIKRLLEVPGLLFTTPPVEQR